LSGRASAGFAPHVTVKLECGELSVFTTLDTRDEPDVVVRVYQGHTLYFKVTARREHCVLGRARVYECERIEPFAGFRSDT
jgi:hypothetical protein